MPIRTVLVAAAALAAGSSPVTHPRGEPRAGAGPGGALWPAPRVIIVVWDGLRADGVTAADTPNLAALARRGVDFTDNHATYPTFTMMNAASIATGAFSDRSGFFGNDVYRPGARGAMSDGRPADFSQPVFTEDYGILDALKASYGGRLLEVPTLFQAVQHAGLATVAVGKSGPAYLQDYTRGGMILDETLAWPLGLAKGLLAAGLALPRRAPAAYPAGAIELPAANGDPTAPTRRIVRLSDGVTSDPTDAAGSPFGGPSGYLMHVFTSYLLPVGRPALSLIWLRNPDSTEHAYGVGSADARDALRAQDELLGTLEKALEAGGLASSTDLVVMSDHGHSNTAGPTTLFPLRVIAAGEIGEAAGPAGFSASGDVRLADLLTRAGFVAYDGGGCAYDPVLSGITADGRRIYPVLTDEGGADCGCAWAGKPYTSRGHRVPRGDPPRHGLVVAANGGSDYIYVPDHDAGTVARVVRFLQSREEVGAIFVAGRYGALPGTLPLAAIRAEDPDGRCPDVILSYAFDANAVVGGVRGTEFAGVSGAGSRGMHGSFSPVDVHSVLIACGPHFRSAFADALPSGNVDVAPTVAHILGVELPQAEGRVLFEALAGGGPGGLTVGREGLDSSVATGLRMAQPTSPSGVDVDGARTTYRIHLQTAVVRAGPRRYTYFDFATAIRQ